MQKDLSPAQQQQLQQQQHFQQQRLAALYAMQQQQQGRLPPQPYGHLPPGSMYPNTGAMMANDPSRLAQAFRPPVPAQLAQLPTQQQPQGVFIRPPGVIQGASTANPAMVGAPDGFIPKFTSPALQQQQHLQQQQQLHLQQAQQAQQQHTQLTPSVQQQPVHHHQATPPPQLAARPTMVPAATTPAIGIRGVSTAAHPNGEAAGVAGPPGGIPINVPPIEATLAETPVQKENLAQYQQRDRMYQDILNTQHKRHLHLAQEKKRDIEISTIERRTRSQGPNGVIATFGPGYQGLGNGTTGLQSKIIYPRDKKRLRRTPLLKFSIDDMKAQSMKDDTLVPIRLEFETDGYKLRDTFTWNLNEQLVTPEQFAELMCEDLRLPPGLFIPQIARAIREQVQDYYLHASSMVTNDPSDGEEDAKDTSSQVISSVNTPSIKSEQQANSSPRLVNTTDDSDQDPVKKKSKRNAELRMLIKLDITVGHKALIDQFEWDISCPENSPEEFAEVLSGDLGLGGEFKTAIAHSIREQVHVYTKSLLLVGHEFDGPVVDDDLKHSFLPLLKGVIRDADAVERFTPAILELTDAELQKNEKDRLREARRKRRQTRGRRGIILPDREPLKTNRTTHETQPEQEMTDEQFFASMNSSGMTNGTRGNTPVQEAMHSQRRSALRARANIAAEAAGYLPGNQPSPQPSPSFMNATY